MSCGSEDIPKGGCTEHNPWNGVATHRDGECLCCDLLDQASSPSCVVSQVQRADEQRHRLLRCMSVVALIHSQQKKDNQAAARFELAIFGLQDRRLAAWPYGRPVPASGSIF